ncbi:hypothetical protein MMC29_003782 [Sticta canariensis]|nr:hypothetical protein [Sticta canariensis]
MSRAAKLTLAGTSLAAIGIVVFVHWAQTAEKKAMHAGVIRDMEQQRIKKLRQAEFDMYQAMEQEYLRFQKVHNENIARKK